MIIPVITAFLLPVLLSLAITPWVIHFAKVIGATDKPDARKVHTVITPRLGGLAVFLSVAISLPVMIFLAPLHMAELIEHLRLTIVLSGSLFLIFLLGFWDDLHPLKPGIKFGIQFLVAAVIYFAGFKISNITNPLGGEMLNVEIIDFPLTLLWIVGITNAFNLIDGLDGLASGIATIACVSIYTVSAVTGEWATAMLALMMAGALVGFLRYNFNPAHIFLGDSGSLFIGFSLALMSIHSTTKITTGFALVFPLLVLVLPITDTLVSMVRRLLGSILNEQTNKKRASLIQKLHEMFMPDRSHIHHQLLSLGLSHRNTVLLLYGISAFFAAGAFAVTLIDSFQESLVIALIFGIVLIYGIKKLKYHEISIFNNGLIMPIYERWVLKKSMYLRLFDLAFIMVSYLVSYWLLQRVEPVIEQPLFEKGQTFVIMISVQLSVFWLAGLYKENIRLIGIGSIIRVVSTIAYAVFATSLLLYYQTKLPLLHTLLFFFFDFYFLLTLTLGFRVAYQVLNFWFNREKKGRKNILIYGANETGALMLNHLNHSADSEFKVLGFLDDDSTLENKHFDGYPVWGAHWKLPKIVKRYPVHSIFLCEDEIKAENLRRLSKIAEDHNIGVKRLNISLEEVSSKNIPRILSASSKPMISYS
ncbi:undecaprenyl-phosphate alpha-N-acetylglucosaminyl 1-phosphate transferase [Gracilimonas tropica]|uniref:undecaprenyl-phosphate alpha-N-acetylglucosaminyl 1-phosphate transferase n=1 Tax=Gracilimonas tropica TaxID=454600 RepID=UPI00037FB53A|nr:undecaprenyl-phosphate alpha-N-acetylglucosaminyl 1-phosphate transferase [Gracilimonas tropica]